LVYVCRNDDGWDAAFHCSFERIATILSAALRRLITLRIMDAASRDRELLVRELRHRTRNTLQLIKNSVTFLVRTLSDATAAALESLDARICALVSVHEMLSFIGETSLVSAESYFSRLAAALQRITPEGSGSLVSLYDSDEDALIPVDRAATIGLIVYELVVNSIKHAVGRSGLMRLRVSFDGGNLIIRYSDSPRPECAERAGCTAEEPAPRYAPRAESAGSGLRLIEALIGRARGIRLLEDSGRTAFAARFPLAR
jgi:two-component sensor histidine kinase